MIVCITEKPSVARDISKILGANERKDGYFEGNGYRVTWTLGHLCTLKEPADYFSHWKRWTLSNLPMIPERFGIKLIENDSYIRQFNTIKKLVEEADEVVNCGDAGQEGELIQRWVLQKAGVKCPVKRLWISSLTDESIRKGFEDLKDSSEFENLYYAGLSRAIGDWLLGLNSTRLYSLRYSDPGTTLSVGRVQTPTLTMIVARQHEIDNFKSEDYWELHEVYRDVVFNQSPAKKYKSKEEAKEIVDKISKSDFTITDIEKKTSKESAPRLFDLTSLQVECNSRFGWSAEMTLKLIQTLYEKKLTTYPRVDTTYLSEDLYLKVPDILRKMKPYEKFTSKLLEQKITRTKKIFDNSKVTDHHAIIPTDESPKILTDTNERQLYHLIALRFLAAFYPDCKYNVTTVTGKKGDLGFKTTGKIIVESGWREVLENSDPQKSKQEDGETILPDFIVGEKGQSKTEIKKKSTTPPKYFTEGTLLKAMETAGKQVESEELREALKENGIGRPSTRAAIIEILIKRGYVERSRKKLIATEAGKHLIATIKDDLLKSPSLTGIWEQRLRRIENGDYSPAEFISLLKEQIQTIIETVLSDTESKKIEIVQKQNAKAKKTSKQTKTIKKK